MPVGYTSQRSVQVSGFTNICLLTPLRRLISASCSSGQRFAFSFLRIRSRPRHPCRSASTSPCRVCRGLSPPSTCALPGAQKNEAADFSCRAPLQRNPLRAPRVQRLPAAALEHLLLEAFHTRHPLFQRIAHDGLLIRRERRVQREPRIAYLLAQRAIRSLHVVSDGGDGGQVGFRLGELGSHSVLDRLHVGAAGVARRL